MILCAGRASCWDLIPQQDGGRGRASRATGPEPSCGFCDCWGGGGELSTGTSSPSGHADHADTPCSPPELESLWMGCYAWAECRPTGTSCPSGDWCLSTHSCPGGLETPTRCSRSCSGEAFDTFPIIADRVLDSIYLDSKLITCFALRPYSSFTINSIDRTRHSR